MLSFLSRCSLRLCSSCTPVVCISNLLVSRFSSVQYVNDPEYRADFLARRKARYHNDPEFRAKLLAASSTSNKARYVNDPDFRAKLIAQASIWSKARYVNPDRREVFRVRNAARVQKYHNDFLHKQRISFRAWISRNLHKRELTWRTHEIESHANEVTHTCSGPNCGYQKKLKLWMRRKGSDPALYDCFKCFTSDWVPEKVLPIGHERMVWGPGGLVRSKVSSRSNSHVDEEVLGNACQRGA